MADLPSIAGKLLFVRDVLKKLLEEEKEKLRRDNKTRLEVAYQKLNEVLDEILEEILDV